MGVSVWGLRGRATLTTLVLFLELARLACRTLQHLWRVERVSWWVPTPLHVLTEVTPSECLSTPLPVFSWAVFCFLASFMLSGPKASVSGESRSALRGACPCTQARRSSPAVLSDVIPSSGIGALRVCFKKSFPAGVWVAQSGVVLTLGFSSGHNVRVARWSLLSGSTLSGEPAGESLCPSPTF